ncbi:erythromycin esterase family protein [Micromonospora sp. WMMD1082]|uniref:NAD(P)H-dependent oxidoreductase n=1 Tax=Micromonospora sp. WMMD1082 TaxID=3016104 RepID=UPI00241811EC|nr:erythromycin esterase family protein [Micromonospora sp. WMMD1082]MDG4798310.1 erythromycin esterase family protein [Micromonospora sp. WMMD1082]
MSDQTTALNEHGNRADEPPLNLVVVVASVRDDRIGRILGDWVMAQIPGDVRTHMVDLTDLHLPPDSDLQPGGGQPTPASDLMAAADGFVIVTPEYNHSYPACLKRFVDWHYGEWQFKAAMVVPYGVQGGLLAGEYLRPVFAELSVVTTRRMVALRAPWVHLTEGRYVAPDGEDGAVRDAVRELSWWAGALREARRRRPFGGVDDTGNAASEAVVSWLAAQPETVDPTAIADLASDAFVVGLGGSTREAHEPFQIVEHATHALIDRGFRVLAILDNQRVGALYDRYVRGADVNIDSSLRQGWGPWQTSEMRDALTRLRRRNATRPDDPVRVIGVGGSRVLPADYDRVVDLIAAISPAEVPQVRELLAVIRTAHDNGEHVQRAQGTHPGTPFVKLARKARAIAGRLEGAGQDEAVRLLDMIVEHHANAIGVGYDAEREERAAAERILEWHRRTGDRIVLWEGSAHVAAHGGVMLGSHLREALGDRYFAGHVTFGHGLVRNSKIPLPASGSLEDLLLCAGGERTVNLAADVPVDVAARLDAPWRTRLISGVYDPGDDAEHYYELPSLRSSFDVVVFVPMVAPIQPLPPDRAA